jgi:Transposase DDE domain
VIAAVRALHTVELAGESVRAALEVLAAACPGWLAQRICVADWNRRYGARIDSWRLPAGKAAQDRLTLEFARDGYALVQACYEDSAPGWARELPAVQTLRMVLLQNFTRTAGEHGREVIREREPEGKHEHDGVPPAHIKISSPYDTDARWGKKDESLWLGYKLHITETCEDPPACGCPPGPAAAPGRCGHDVRPNLITCVATTGAAAGDAAMTIPVSAALARKRLAPARHYLDSGYASARNMLEAARLSGTILVTPLLAGTSPQARAGHGYDRSAFGIDYDARTVTRPQGAASASWTPTRLRGTDVIAIKFPLTTCRPCPARQLCTTATRTGRQLTLPPRELHDIITRARAGQATQDWHDDYKRRAGAEATISQAITITGCRRARYRGLAKTRLEHVYSAVALNLYRLDAYWNDTPIHRERTSHLARLDPSLRPAT